MANGEDSRFAHIDALRAFAALLVVWIHTSEAFDQLTDVQTWPHSLAQFIDFGRTGVVVFFLVSGFVIPSSLDRDGPRLPLAREFVIRRFFRLYPLYWLSIPLGVLTARTIWGNPFGWGAFMANFTMIQEFFGIESAEGLYWTLHTELVFYALCLGIFLVFGLRSIWVLAAAAAAFLALPAVIVAAARLTGGWGTTADAFYLCVDLSVMFCGALLRRWHDGSLGAAGKIVTAALVAFWILEPMNAVALLPFPVFQNLPHANVSYTAAVVVFLIGTFLIRIRIPAIVQLGRASYSLYLFHPIVFWPLVRLCSIHYLPVLRDKPLWIYMLVAIGLSIGLALFLYRRVEQPMIRLGARLARRLAPPAVEAV